MAWADNKMQKSALHQQFISSLSGKCIENVSLRNYTTWHIGGEAELFLQPACYDDIISAWNYAHSNNLAFNVIGAGSNILVDDNGIPGVIMCMRESLNALFIDLPNRRIIADAGCLLPKLSAQVCKMGVAGFEFLAGIPGTVGGGLVTNAGIGGQNGASLKDVLHSVEAFDLNAGQVVRLEVSELELGYRSSSICDKNIIILKAIFDIHDMDNPEKLASIIKEIKMERRRNQPPEPYNAGSVFKRTSDNKSAGWYIDQAGLKGYRIGGAFVSHKHANWIINDGNAASADVKRLISFIKKQIFEKYGIELETEVKYLP